jgi:hypothetical protein
MHVERPGAKQALIKNSEKKETDTLDHVFEDQHERAHDKKENKNFSRQQYPLCFLRRHSQ